MKKFAVIAALGLLASTQAFAGTSTLSECESVAVQAASTTASVEARVAGLIFTEVKTVGTNVYLAADSAALVSKDNPAGHVDFVVSVKPSVTGCEATGVQTAFYGN